MGNGVKLIGGPLDGMMVVWKAGWAFDHFRSPDDPDNVHCYAMYDTGVAHYKRPPAQAESDDFQRRMIAELEADS